MDDLRALLAAFGPQWNETVLESLVPLFRRRACRKGEALLQQGERWDSAWLVERGLLRLFFLRPDGREFNKNFIVERELVCPLTPIMWEGASLFGIRCLEPSILWSADAGMFRSTLERQGQWHVLQREALARLVDHKLQREHDLLALTACGATKRSVIRFPGLADGFPLRTWRPIWG
jgi:CRP-like cAMP-binding protein